MSGGTAFPAYQNRGRLEENSLCDILLELVRYKNIKFNKSGKTIEQRHCFGSPYSKAKITSIRGTSLLLPKSAFHFCRGGGGEMSLLLIR